MSSPEDETSWLDRVRDWCRGRSPWLRLLLLVYFGYVGVGQFLHPVEFYCIFQPLNLCIHEGGHLLFRWAGDGFLHTAGGTFAQLAAPLICLVLLLRQPDYFGVPFCLAWLSTNLIGVGVYMADARARELPLVTAEAAGSDEQLTGHDWADLFGRFHLLPYDTTIGYCVRGLGSVVMLAALATGIALVILMFFPKALPPENDPYAEKRELIRRRKGRS
jgi:hypothetical protein